MYDQDGSASRILESRIDLSPKAQYHEQRPTDCECVVASIRGLLVKSADELHKSSDWDVWP